MPDIAHGLLVFCFFHQSGFCLFSTINAWLMEYVWNDCPSGRFSHFWFLTSLGHGNGPSGYGVLGHLSKKDQFSLITEFGQMTRTRKNLGGHSFPNDGIVLLGTLNALAINILTQFDHGNLQRDPSINSLVVCLVLWIKTYTHSCGPF